MREVFLIMILFFLIGCDGQSKTNDKNNPKKTRIFNIENFEKNKGKGKITDHPDMYDYETKDFHVVTQYGTTFTSKGHEKEYMENIDQKFSPLKYNYIYDQSGSLKHETMNFNNSIVYVREYDKNGKLIKDTNFDKSFKHTFEQIREIVLKEKKVDIYDTRQAVALRHDTPDAAPKKYYQIHVLKSELVEGEWYSQPNYSFLIDDETGKILNK
ncbi:hypothetical protein [Chryseobacterium sp. ERMR1:04]|uniref:hypothetical protein n=1 Tax=Chryseobacterium sp. ERMR1:04 TaxID=1705393 RepID=UPI0006C882F1|nr:hypothetical protein [Chryseobacterium sp. ERMR1:04]